MEKKKIMYESNQAAEYRTNIQGWVSSEGRFFGSDEHMARWHGSTHKICECGNEMSKGWTICESCRTKKADEEFNLLEEVEWDGVSMISIYHDDRFFSDIGDVYEYCEEEEIDIKDLKLVICKKSVNISEVNIDELNEEYTTEDGRGVSDFHPEIADKVSELNELIRNAKPTIWFATNKRIKLP
jgi:hypothetical protein